MALEEAGPVRRRPRRSAFLVNPGDGDGVEIFPNPSPGRRASLHFGNEGRSRERIAASKSRGGGQPPGAA